MIDAVVVGVMVLVTVILSFTFTSAIITHYKYQGRHRA